MTLRLDALDDALLSLRGAQEPRIRRAPDYASTSGPEAIELCELAGLHLDPWEQLVVTDMLGERVDGKWAAYEYGLNAPRQNGKGSILEGRELTGAFLLGEKLIIHSAHEQRTSSEHFRRLLNLIEGVPEFDRRVLKTPKGKGSEAIELRGGQRILFVTRTSGGGRGLTGDLVVLDEAMILTLATMAALVPTMAARSIVGNPQLIYAGSAVDQEKHEHGLVFTRVRQRALAHAARLGYAEWSADVARWRREHGLAFDEKRCELDQVTPEMLADPQMWAQANPGLGIRISVEHVANEHGGAMGGQREFAVERLGIPDPPDTTEDAGRVIAAAVWSALAELDEANHITSTPTYAVDASPDHAWAAVGVAGQRDDKLRQVAVVEHARDTDWVIDCCSRLQKRDKRSVFVVDGKGPAASLIDDLKDAGVKVLIASAEDYGNACAQFLNAVTSGHVRYPAPQPELDDAVAAAREATLGDRWKWARRTSTSPDISTLVAVTLALWGHMRKPAAPRVINPYDYI